MAIPDQGSMANSEPLPQGDERSESQSLVSTSMKKAIALAKDRLLDRSLRNKLINTPLVSSKARQVRVFDEVSQQVFRHLQSKKAFQFVARKEGDAKSEAANPERHSDNRLQTQLTSEGLQKRLLSLFYEAETLEQEQGVNILFLALGFLEWREHKNSEQARYAPLILFPVELIRDGAKDKFKLRARDEDLITNVSLQAWLKDQFGIELPELPEDEDWTPQQYFDSVRRSIGQRSAWSVHENEILLGFFSFSKFLLWKDLDPENWNDPKRLLENGILKKLLLREQQEESLEDTPIIKDDERIDEVFPPAKLIHVTDADSSQAIAIQEVLSGKNLVIQGPPGTGKSQTITNVIAGAVHDGKRVLFIAEKMAALEVVHERLKKKNLEAICLELHSRKSSKTQVLEQIRKGQKAPPPGWSDTAFEELASVQRSLRSYSDRLHHKSANKFSAFYLMGKIGYLKGKGVATPDFHIPHAADWPPEVFDKNILEARQVAERLIATGVPSSHPWRGAGLTSPDPLTRSRITPVASRCFDAWKQLVECRDAVCRALNLDADPTIQGLKIWIGALQLISRRPPSFDQAVQRVSNFSHLNEFSKLVELGEIHQKLTEVARSNFRPEAFAEDWIKERGAIAAHGKSLLRFLSKDYRAAIAKLKTVWIGEFPKPHIVKVEALDALIDSQRMTAEITAVDAKLVSFLGEHWRGIETDWKRLRLLSDWLGGALEIDKSISVIRPDRVISQAVASALESELSQKCASAEQRLSDLASMLQMDWMVAFGKSNFTEVSTSTLLAASVQWSSLIESLVDWTAARDGLSWLKSIGCDALAERAFDGRIKATELEDILAISAYEAMWSRLRETDSKIDQIFGDELNRQVSRFRRADLDRIALASDQTRRAHIDGAPAGSAGATGILLDELRKSRNLMPVRKLMLRAGDAIQRFKPVFLMSPLSVAQYLPPGVMEFDLLVIDEASQVRPEDALGVIARCNQLVVVGDDRQLPPTNFFNTVVNDDASDGDDTEHDEATTGIRRAQVKDVESILNLCAQFPSRMLRWHYRSEHPVLIATSNRHFYEGALMLPPTVVVSTTDGNTGLLYREVPQGGYERGKTARNEIEASIIAGAVLKHAQESPDISLGIGTFSVAQRDCIRDCIDDLARQHQELDAFLRARPNGEPLFVKNLENIQGDERDVIFISVGYGRDADGRLTQNFGPVGRDGGERRLNVLITRARKRCEVFSSIVAEDIRFDGVGKPGVGALKEFLKLAKDGYASIATTTERGFDSPLEESIALAVRNLGYAVHPQVGMSGFFIDLAVIDPKNEGRYVLGIECDGAAYHSSRYARERDRLRQEILERRGWKIHRVWSTDWFYKPEREIERIKAAIEAASTVERVSRPASPTNEEPLPAEGEKQQRRGFGESEESYGREVTGLPLYEMANFRVHSTPVHPQSLSERELVHSVKRIVEIEQPIHTDQVGRRLASVCGKQRATNNIREIALKGLRAAKREGDLIADGDFWRLFRADTSVVRDRSRLEASEGVRKPEYIAPSEVEAAAILVLEQSLAIERDSLITEVARLLGFSRTGPDIRAAVEKVIERQLRSKVALDHLGRIKLKVS